VLIIIKINFFFLEVITYHTLFVVVESRYENDFLRRHRIAAFLISRFRLFSLLKPKKTIGSTGKVKYRSSLYREHRKSEIPQLCLFVLVKAMWRRSSLSLSQTLTFSSSKLLQFQSYGAVRPLYSSSSSPSSSSSAPNSFDLGFPKPDGTPAFSATALDLSSLASASASTARHYARCYWELSKARLRFSPISLYVNSNFDSDYCKTICDLEFRFELKRC
jgi:hypothetical protein